MFGCLFRPDCHYAFGGFINLNHINDTLQAKELPTFKDNDFVNDGAVISVGPEEKEKIMQILQKDVEVMADFSRVIHIKQFTKK